MFNEWWEWAQGGGMEWDSMKPIERSNSPDVGIKPPQPFLIWTWTRLMRMAPLITSRSACTSSPQSTANTNRGRTAYDTFEWARWMEIRRHKINKLWIANHLHKRKTNHQQNAHIPLNQFKTLKLLSQQLENDSELIHLFIHNKLFQANFYVFAQFPLCLLFVLKYDHETNGHE